MTDCTFNLPVLCGELSGHSAPFLGNSRINGLFDHVNQMWEMGTCHHRCRSAAGLRSGAPARPPLCFTSLFHSLLVSQSLWLCSRLTLVKNILWHRPVSLRADSRSRVSCYSPVNLTMAFFTLLCAIKDVITSRILGHGSEKRPSLWPARRSSGPITSV